MDMLEILISKLNGFFKKPILKADDSIDDIIQALDKEKERETSLIEQASSAVEQMTGFTSRIEALEQAVKGLGGLSELTESLNNLKTELDKKPTAEALEKATKDLIDLTNKVTSLEEKVGAPGNSKPDNSGIDLPDSGIVNSKEVRTIKTKFSAQN